MKVKIDYPNHPGFKNLVVSPPPSTNEINQFFETLNDVYRSFLAKKEAYSESQIHSLLRNEVEPVIDSLKTIVIQTMRPEDWYFRPAMEALDGLSSTLKDELIYRNLQKSYRQKKLSGKAEKIVNDLQSQGFSIRRIENETIRKIWHSLIDFRKLLEDKRASRPRGMASCNLSLPKKGEHWRLTRTCLEELGIIDAVNAYSKFPMDLDYCAMQLSHDDEDWYKDCYSDVGLATQKTAYMHCDQDFSLMKAIIYLEDVTSEKGPFSIVGGENFLNGGYVQQRFLTQLDSSSIGRALAEGKTQGLSYYRPLFKQKEMRKEFLKLPVEMQGTTHFGDDLIDGDALSNYLLGKEVKLTSNLGNCALFSGGRNIHRGGTVPSGERWAFQVGFRQRDLSWRGSIKRVGESVKLHTPSSFKKAIRSLMPKNI